MADAPVDGAAAAGRRAVIERFLRAAGWDGAARRPLAGDASSRRYERLDRQGHRAVLMDAPPPLDSARRFVAVARLLREHGFSAPEVYAAAPEDGLLLVEDLGDAGFARLLAEGVDAHALYGLAVDVLVALRRRVPAEALRALPEHDEAAALDGLARLLDWHWPARFGAPPPAAVREEYLSAWRAVLPLGRSVPEGLALFDFHVENLMLLEGRDGVAACGLLDIQDAVRAPVTLDLVCLLEDARRDVDPALAAAMRERYLAAFPEIDRDGFALSWAVVGAERNARILGTFARLWKRDGKPGYLAHLPRVWRRLEGDLAHPALARVRRWFDSHLPPPLRGSPLGPEGGRWA